MANKLRLLRLSPACVELLRSYQLTERHARTLLRLADEEERLAAARHVGERHLNVAQTEEYVEQLLSPPPEREAPERRRAFILKDVRVFLNSLSHSLDVMKRGGIEAGMKKRETDEELIVTISIPKKGREGPEERREG